MSAGEEIEDALIKKGIGMAKQNLSIQGLRGLLCAMVVVFHVYRGMVSENLMRQLEDFPWVESIGRVSVNLFFVISGYLIIQSLIKHQNLSKFFINRVLRIYPVFIVIHLLLFTAGPLIHYEWMSGLSVSEYILHFMSNLMLLPGIFQSLPIAQIVSWSVSYEFLFYILIGVMYNSIMKRESKWHVILIITSAIASLAFVYFHPRSLFFLVGILAYKTAGPIKKKIKYKSVFYFNGLILLTLLLIFYSKVPLLISLCLGFLIFYTLINEEGILASILRNRVFQYLGNISYSLYLWHTLAMFPFKNVLMPRLSVYISSPLILFVIFLILTLTASIVVSHLSYRFIEKKLTTLIKSSLTKDDSVRNAQVTIV